MGLINWFKGKTCPSKKHKGFTRYRGISVIGYECEYCGYRWYKKRYPR